MPNSNTNQIMIDSTRRGRVVLTGQFDGASGQETQVLKLNTWGLRGALSNATNSRQLLASALNGTYNRGTYNVVITGIDYAITPGGQVTLHWQGSSVGTAGNVAAVLIGSGSLGDGGRSVDFIIDPRSANNSGHTGNLMLSTLALVANGGYTISIDFKKDPTKFDQGQISSPQDFNANI